MSLQSQISPVEIAKNLDKYSFKCETVMIVPEIKIYEKETNKLINVSEMRLQIHSGTLNEKYCSDFFRDIIDEAPIAFAEEVNRRVVRYKGKTQEGKQDGQT